MDDFQSVLDVLIKMVNLAFCLCRLVKLITKELSERRTRK